MGTGDSRRQKAQESSVKGRSANQHACPLRAVGRAVKSGDHISLVLEFKDGSRMLLPLVPCD
jgi:hypothetical protein